MTVDYAAIAAAAYANQRPTARKTGRNPAYPYVPVIEDIERLRTDQIRARAFATRSEAVEYAEQQITRNIASLAERLALPQNRALREQYGLPRELDPA